MVGAKRF